MQLILIFKDFEIKNSLFLLVHGFLCPCYLMTRFYYLNYSCFFSPFLSQRKIPDFCCWFLWKAPWAEQRSKMASFCKTTSLSSEETLLQIKRYWIFFALIWYFPTVNLLSFLPIWCIQDDFFVMFRVLLLYFIWY